MDAYRLTRKDGAPGIDGVTAADYEVNPEVNLLDLLDLLDRITSGRHRVHAKSGWLAKDARHANLRRQRWCSTP